MPPTRNPVPPAVVLQRFWSKVDKTATVPKSPHVTTPCWEWTGSRRNIGRYGSFGFQGKVENTHRVSWVLAFGEIVGGLQVLHRCDNMGCVRPDHLFLGTNADNNADMVAKARNADGVRLRPETRARGERGGSAKLTEAAVLAIRARAAAGEATAALADAFRISRSNVGAIVRRVTWAHVAP